MTSLSTAQCTTNYATGIACCKFCCTGLAVVKFILKDFSNYSLTSLLCQLWDLVESWCCDGMALEWGDVLVDSLLGG